MAVQQPETIEVAAVEVRRTPSSLVRVVFGGGGLAGFAVSGVPDEACLLHLPLADGAIDEHGRVRRHRLLAPRRVGLALALTGYRVCPSGSSRWN
jgi:NADPH-dependent ferric siderophore reductase